MICDDIWKEYLCGGEYGELCCLGVVRQRDALASFLCGLVVSFSSTNRIDEEIEDKCPDCNTSPHNTNHLFNCQLKPPSLTPIDLWTNPDLVASFLDLDQSGVT